MPSFLCSLINNMQKPAGAFIFMQSKQVPVGAYIFMKS